MDDDDMDASPDGGVSKRAVSRPPLGLGLRLPASRPAS